ncbi:MAG: peptidylprolyl isomerase [Flavobacteriales bacterium]
MAVIGKIRERSGLLLVLVGGALVLFIVGEFISGRGSGRQDRMIGVVGGEEIGVAEFDRRVTDEIESYRNDFGQTVNAQMTDQVRNSVWQEMVKERVMLPQVEDAGFTLTRSEYDDIRFGENILPDFKNQPNFQGEDGQVDRERLKQYFSNVQLNAPVYHEIQTRRIRENRLYAKYTTLVKKSVFVNSAQARDEYTARNTKSTFNFVAKRYDGEPDSLYTVSEQELSRYYAQHKNDVKYKQKPSRKFEYALFPVIATEGDRQQIKEELTTLKAEFASASNDSAFVMANADSRNAMAEAYTEGTTDKVNDSLIVNAAVGEVVGPFVDGDVMKLVKVEELADVPEARVRHILLSTQQGKGEEEQKKRADSLLTVVKRDRSKFADLVTKFSDDPGSTGNGGVYEWFDKNKMVPEFTAASFDEKVGAITIAKTTYGYHIVEVLDKRTRQERRVLTVDRALRPSPASFKDVYKTANEFSLRNKTPEAFKAAAEESGIQVTPVDELRPDMRSVPGLQQANSVISWVNRAKVGEVSEPWDAGDNYVVAMLTGIRAEGVPELADVRETFTAEVIKEKKAEAFIGRMQGKTDLNTLASELGVAVQNAPEMVYTSFNIPGGYSEYGVIGKIFALNAGETSIPLKGENGVYVVNVVKRDAAGDPGDLANDRETMLKRAQGRAENGVFNALRDAAGVKDDRSSVY